MLDDDSEWMSVADLMAGLMVIFLFLAVVFIRVFEDDVPDVDPPKEPVELIFSSQEPSGSLLGDRDWVRPDLDFPVLEDEPVVEIVEQNLEIKKIVHTWQQKEEAIYEALIEEFYKDLDRWNAEIERETLQVRFRSPEVLFESGRSDLRPEFSAILQDFFPRYVGVIDRFRANIDEVRIEGHTSSTWNRDTTSEEAYFLNMALSQQRTRAVLKHAMSLSEVTPSRDWLQPLLTANGLSSSRPILTTDGVEDVDRSRRVEFRIRTTARAEILRILEVSQ
ncbi:OmpA family protein [Palleronia sp.]|uniref:OmpA family protein n=1 Tax=Palleronia sp. TaxID=1940284 RepID=UPI0035C7EBBD